MESALPHTALTHSQRLALTRAIERRFGQSTLPYSFRRWAERDGWTVVDLETGSWVKGYFGSRGRLVVIGHHDAELAADIASKYASVQQAA